jgi:hypothetical protein
MSVNKVTMVPNGVDKQINIPVRLTWDYLGLDMAIEEYETEVITEVIGIGRDFEIDRFAHAPDSTTNNTEINYEFYFYSGGSINDINNWKINYMGEGFTPQDLYYYTNDFANSFFKLDFYDNTDEKKQTNYLTVIIPTQQGLKMSTQMQRIVVDVRKPKFILDYVGDKEGFFIYWLKKREFLNIDTFYMSAKFYNAKTGQFTKMMTGKGWDPNVIDPCNTPWPSVIGEDLTEGPQACIGGDKYNFDNNVFFYYVVNLDYESQTYQVVNSNGQRLGTTIPIKWFEYLNPPV